ncbi:PREDICTED: FK506-binding protein 5-like [Dufourea novaeangliae]|uniref:FK506-binding protein 5-like n=1 Tax=Dufourea novaeangliae TaxID=178035 RepID=UPI000766F25C|nr:PREDICTED: FK506-binding protein 5-like [Dufourea novaeangliae]
MVLGTLFGPKTPKSDQPEDSLDIKKDSLFSPEETEQSPKVNNTSIVYPFHDVKATSFPPPLSIDASVYTDAENQVEEQTDTATERSPVSNNIKNIKEDVKDDEKKENSLKKHGEETKPKISHDRLKEVINASIKEAVQIIAKQCRMVSKKQKPNDEEKSSGKKPKETLAKAIWHTKEGVLGKSKHETRPRSTEEYFSNRSRLPKNAYKSNCPQEKRNIVRTCPNKLQDEITKCLCKKGPVCEDAKDKKHSKQASSGKTDNRRMTGNVNIYICSEATENPQLAYKQNKPQSCAESSSETTTEPSPVSSCKLVNCIRNKRQKYKEKDSFDFLQSTEESSDSNPFSCVSSNIGTNSESSGFIDICAQDTESTSTECRCKDDQVISDQSIGKSKFVICDKAERPCSTIYPKKVSLDSDSEGWSSKSVCSDSRETEPCNQANGDGWPFEPKFGYYTKSLKRDRDPGKDSCRICSKNDVCRCQSNARSKRRSYKSTDREQWSTCSCIVEEDEEDGVCVNVKDSPKSTVDLKPTGTQEGVTVDQKDTEKELEKIASAVKEDGAEKETIQEQKDDDLVAKPSSLISGKLIRPETLTLKLLLKQYGTPPAQSLEQKSIIPDLAKTTDTGLSTNDTPVAQTEEKKEPAYRKKFNLREQHRFMKHLTSEQFEKPREPIEETKQVDQAEEKKTEENENEKDTEQRMSLPGRLRTSIFKTLKRVAGKENYKISEKVSDNDADRETVNAEGNIDTDQPVKSEANLQETQKEKRISFAQKLDINKFFKRKDKTSVSDTNQIVPKKKGKKTSVTDAAANLDTESESKDDTKKGEEEKKEELPVEDAEAEQDNSKLLTDTTSSKPDLTLTPDTTVEGTDPTNSQELPKTSTTEVITKKSSPPEVQEESNDQKSTGDQEQKHIEFEKPKITDKEPPKVTETEVGTNVQKVSTCMCIRCARKKKSAISQNVSRESEPSYTVCTSENFGPEERIEGCKCNCCTLQTPQSCNRLTSYPKSCLKKERQFCRMETQENNCSVFQHDNRSWEECGCRRMIPCENCCRPRNECRYE